MHLTPSETEKLLLAVAGMVARDRRARGVRLNHPESVALIATGLIVVAGALAGFVPARRAARVNPIVALRD